MDGLQLRDEAVRDRIRLAEEFLDPSAYHECFTMSATDHYRRRCTSPKVGGALKPISIQLTDKSTATAPTSS